MYNNWLIIIINGLNSNRNCALKDRMAARDRGHRKSRSGDPLKQMFCKNQRNLRFMCDYWIQRFTFPLNTTFMAIDCKIAKHLLFHSNWKPYLHLFCCCCGIHVERGFNLNTDKLPSYYLENKSELLKN